MIKKKATEKGTIYYQMMAKTRGRTKVAHALVGALGLPEYEEGRPMLEFLEELEPPDGLSLFDKMRKNDPVVGGLILRLNSVISSLRYSLDGQNAKFIEDEFKNLPGGLRGLINEMLSAFIYGFYIGEKWLTVEKGQMHIKDISPRYQPTIYKINDENRNVEQQTDEATYYIPYDKCVHLVFIEENRNPYGISILRHLYKPYYYKAAIEAAEALGLERDLGGLPVLTAPEGFDFTKADPTSPNYQEAVKATLDWAIDLVSEVRADQQQGVVLPNGWVFELLRGESKGGDSKTTEIISRYNTEMASGILANFASLGAFATTNNANTEVHLESFLQACDSYGEKLADTINEQVIVPLCEFNRKTPPKLSFAPTNVEKLVDLGSFISRLTQNGVITPTTELEHSLLDIAKQPIGKNVKKGTTFGEKTPKKEDKEENDEKKDEDEDE